MLLTTNALYVRAQRYVFCINLFKNRDIQKGELREDGEGDALEETGEDGEIHGAYMERNLLYVLTPLSQLVVSVSTPFSQK